MTIQVKTAETESEKEAIYHLRYEIYIEELGDKKKPKMDHYMTKQIVKLDSSWRLMARS